ncbi:hypothetical protein QS257_03750 [Terrilactibacillus sp. S3-3]|nr:hypothetical protein QS257_03750 [Terrilactibacillus sp. S3-3]
MDKQIEETNEREPECTLYTRIGVSAVDEEMRRAAEAGARQW